MRKTFWIGAAAWAFSSLYAMAGVPQKGNRTLSDQETYGYLNCHMSDRGQWTAYALSTDGLNYEDVLGGDSIFSSVAMAAIEGGTRDAFICRKADNSGFLMVTTDMNNTMTKKLGKLDHWHNYGINLLKSDDLLKWTSVTFDFRKWQPNVTRVWAPQVMWDESYVWPDGHKGGYMIYYSMLDPDKENYDRMYYSYADADFTTITRPQLLFDWGYATIDADINWIEEDGMYHMMIKKEGGTPGIFTTKSKQLTGPWPEPDASQYVDFEGKKKCEGPSAFQLKGGQWMIGYIEYSSRPKHYRLCEADPTLSKFSNPRDIVGVTGPQHGSFLRLTKEEYLRVQEWGKSQAVTSRKFVLPNSADGQSEVHVSLPAHPSGRAVVCCPGGGYTHLAFEKEGTNWANYFNEKGIALITLKYRMPNGDLNLPLSDAYNAIRMARDSAEVWNINPYDIGIMGSSAGGHLAATVSTHAPLDAAPNFSLLFYPVITLGRGTHEGSARGFLGEKRNDEAMIRLWSADKQVKHYQTPPALILLSNDDRVVPPVENGVAYYSAMRGEGLDCTMHIYPDGGHGWGYADYFKYKKQMLEDLGDWLDRLPHQNREAVRVACVGNSITHGHGIDMKSLFGYPAQLQKLLGKEYNVRNFGYSARTLGTQGDLPYMKEDNWQKAKQFNPNVVIIKLGTNDTKPHNWAHHETLATDLQNMVDTLKALPSQPRIMLCTPIVVFKESWGINDSLIVNGVIPVIRAIAEKNNLEVIDLHSLITDPKLILNDGIHPNEKGCAKMAEIIAEEVKKPAPVAKTTKKAHKKK